MNAKKTHNFILLCRKNNLGKKVLGEFTRNERISLPCSHA